MQSNTPEDEMQSNRWTAFPGDEELALYPISRKIDTISSNSYIISSSNRCILIDTGGLPEQTEEILSVISEQHSQKKGFSGIFLTHTHIDHCFSLINNPRFSPFIQSTYAHLAGAEALIHEDAEITQAALLGRQMNAVEIGHPLFSEDERPGDCGLPETSIPFSDEHEITAYHTPGHSPDSTCYRIGRSLFIGDTLFAGAPGVAGSVGWSRPDLKRSLQGLLRLIPGEEIEVCFSGHGNPIPAQTAFESIRAMAEEVEQLDDIATINTEWARRTAHVAADLMAEIDETLTVISGRIAFVSHMLGELEEGVYADRISSVIDASAVDDLLARYYEFSEVYKRGGHRDIHLVQKAAQIAGKIERLIDRGGLGVVIEPHLIEHLQGLINDYMTIFRGYRPVSSLTATCPARLCRRVMDALSPSSASTSLLDCESDEAFIQGLVQQMGRVQVIGDGAVQITGGDDPADAIIDPFRFERAIYALLLQCAASGAEHTGITIDSGDRVRITICPDRPIMNERMGRYFTQAFSLAGGTVESSSERIAMTFPQKQNII
jgi:glyoxylase-like metal-dependent hydrolase (beta-lactamase superfamily II)